VSSFAGAALEIEGAVVSYGDLIAVRDVSLEVEAGEIVGLLGPNGAGKTTLISTIAGLLTPDRGAVRIQGIDVAENPDEARRALGIAPQDLGIYLQLTVAQNLLFFGKLVGLSGADLRGRVEELAVALGLDELLGRPAQELSGGEKRRLHTAMAMLQRSAVVLLDEPTAGVDVHTRAALLGVVSGLAEDGSAVVYATHYLHEVEAMAASVTILEHGSVIAQGAVEELLAATGQAVVEIRMEGPVPSSLRSLGSVDGDESVIRIDAFEAPGAAAARALGSLGEDADRVRSVEIVQPSLESAFLALTGRRPEDEKATVDSELAP